MNVSYCDLFGICFEREDAPEPSVGDQVSTGLNRFPMYRVIALADGRAWLRDEQSGADQVMPLTRCRPVEARTAVA